MFAQAQAKIKAEVNNAAQGLWAWVALCGVVVWCGGCGGGPTGYQATPPAEAYAWYTRARLLEAQGEVDEAVDAMQRALVADNGSPALLAATARLLCAHGRSLAQAEGLLRLAERGLGPRDAGWLVLVEAQVVCAGSDGEAAEAVGRGLARFPGDEKLLGWDAEVALRQGDIDRAYARLTTLHQQQPHQPRYAQQLAALDLSRDQPQRALARLSPFLTDAAPEGVFVVAADAHAAARDPLAAHEVLRACLDVHFQSEACEQRLSALLTRPRGEQSQ